MAQWEQGGLTPRALLHSLETMGSHAALGGGPVHLSGLPAPETPETGGNLLTIPLPLERGAQAPDAAGDGAGGCGGEEEKDCGIVTERERRVYEFGVQLFLRRADQRIILPSTIWCLKHLSP